MSSFTAPINALVGFISRIQMLKADMSRVEDIQKYEIASQFLQEEFHPLDEKLSGDVWLKQVSFGYSPLAAPVIKDFSFHVQPGRTVALVGASGCGKSTVAKVISSLYDPW